MTSDAVVLGDDNLFCTNELPNEQEIIDTMTQCGLKVKVKVHITYYPSKFL